MTITEKIEIALIPIIGIACWFIAPAFPDLMPLGRLVLITSALLLLQSLLRDLWLLARSKHSAKNSAENSNSEAAQCMCMESTIGMTGVIIGGILFASGIGHPISMSEWMWSILVILVLSCGFLIKDYIFEWNPWRIRREKDHMNIVFTWKK